MTDAYIRRIQEVYPELPIDEVEPNEIGQNNNVLIVNQSIVFRFPKHVQGVEKLKRETQLLKFIRCPSLIPCIMLLQRWKWEGHLWAIPSLKALLFGRKPMCK